MVVVGGHDDVMVGGRGGRHCCGRDADRMAERGDDGRKRNADRMAEHSWVHQSMAGI